MAAPSAGRRDRLTQRLLSAEVRQPEPAAVQEVPAELSWGEVEKVFTDHVPGVRSFLFRGQPGNFSLNFICGVYFEGLRAFKGTDLDDHFTWLMRTVVHAGHRRGEEVGKHLRDVAEAFTECQAVQARAVERAGLQLLGVAADFRGAVVGLVAEYKTMALKMLAADRLARGLAFDGDEMPTHYENRLTVDVGPLVGASAVDVRRARLDEHAEARFERLRGRRAVKAAARCRELFDLTALLQAFVAEVNRFSAESPAESLPALFLKWASENLRQQHVVLDEATLSGIDIDATFALSVLEVLFLGASFAPAGERFRAEPVRELFLSVAAEEPVEPEETEALLAPSVSDAAKASPRKRCKLFQLCSKGRAAKRRRNE